MYSSREHILSFATARPWEVVSVAKLLHGIKGKNVYLGLVNAVKGKFIHIHCSAYGGYAKEAQFEGYS